jgi:hypothetical protein
VAELGLVELKARAFEVGFSHLHLTKPFLKHTQHITKSLTVENVPYEVFSTFSATFEVVRKVNCDSRRHDAADNNE